MYTHTFTQRTHVHLKTGPKDGQSQLLRRLGQENGKLKACLDNLVRLFQNKEKSVDVLSDWVIP